MQFLKSLRTERGWTQLEVSKKLGIDRTTYAKYESGASEPNLEMIRQLTELFDVPTDYLIGNRKAQNGAARIPVLGDVAAGIPIEAVEDIVDWEEVDEKTASSGDLFGLRIKGASMEPRIREGDVVIVRKQSDAQTGDVAVVLVNGDSATVKKIKKDSNGIWLIPFNQAFDTQFYSNDEIMTKPVTIIGKVVELRGKF